MQTTVLNIEPGSCCTERSCSIVKSVSSNSCQNDHFNFDIKKNKTKNLSINPFKQKNLRKSSGPRDPGFLRKISAYFRGHMKKIFRKTQEGESIL